MKRGAINRIWHERVRANERVVRDYAQRSPVLACIDCVTFGFEWRTVLAFNTKTLVRDRQGAIRREGPVVVGIRYLERFVTEAPDPFEIAVVLRPLGIFHPNATAIGAICLGHPPPAIPMESIINQLWAGLMLNLKIANTRKGHVVNPEAAVYVRANADQFPLTRKGLFERPDADLRNGDWHATYDPHAHSLEAKLFYRRKPGEGA